MKFMILVKASKESEAGQMPNEKILGAMAKYNEELVKAGALLDLNGLQPSSKGARLSTVGGKAKVVDGPFAEAKELVAGYWTIQVKSKDEAVAWAKRIPFIADPATYGEGEVEIRQVFELDDFGKSDAVSHHERVGKELERQKQQ